jgi:hypothetical protein
MKHTATALLLTLAATGAPDLNTRATRLGIKNFTNDDVLCNGLPLNEFMRMYRTITEPDTVFTSYRKGDGPPETASIN